MIDQTDIYAMCPLCDGYVKSDGELVGDCGGDDPHFQCAMMQNLEKHRVYAFRTATGEVCVVDHEDKQKVFGYAWRTNKDGHVEATIRGRKTFIHRLVTGCLRPDVLVDHIHGEKLDNRKSQLREATVEQNRQNRRKKTHGTSSNFVGVYYSAEKKAYVASIQCKDEQGVRRNRYLGRFDKAEDAAHAYDKAARELYGQFAVTNFGDKDDLSSRSTGIGPEQ